MLKKITKPKNLPNTISVNDNGALNKKGNVWLRRSSEIKRIDSKGTATSTIKKAQQ